MKRLPWCDARYVRLYCDDHPDWVTLSFEAQGLYALLRRRADRSGLLPLGIDGLAGLSGLIGHSAIADRLEPFIQELVRKGFLELHGEAVLIPEFIESENALASPSSRKRKEREKRRDLARLSSVPASAPESHARTSRQDVTPSVTERDNGVDVTPAGHAYGHDRTSRQQVTHTVTTGRHAIGHDNKSLSSQLFSTDQIPPNPPPGGSSDGGEDGSIDPNQSDIRKKLASMGKPLCFLVATRADERLYAPVLTGAMTTADILAAIDDAALTLGPELGTVQAGDVPELAKLERYVAGCIKRARRDRHTTSAPVSPPARPSAPSARQAPRQPPSEMSPESEAALDIFRDLYVNVGRYERFIEAPDDGQRAADALAECAKHAERNYEPHDVFVGAAEAYFADDFYAGQGHSLRRFAAVLRSEPTRLLGKRRSGGASAPVDVNMLKELLIELEKHQTEFDQGKIDSLPENHARAMDGLRKKIAEHSRAHAN